MVVKLRLSMLALAGSARSRQEVSDVGGRESVGRHPDTHGLFAIYFVNPYYRVPCPLPTASIESRS